MKDIPLLTSLLLSLIFTVYVLILQALEVGFFWG